MTPLLLVFSMLLLTTASAPAPADDKESAASAGPDDVLYDQRQNGTENLRISLSDVMVVVAPAESLTPLAMDAFNMLALGAVKDKVQGGQSAECGETGARCRSAQSQYRHKLRLSSFLQPLLSKNQHHR